MRYEDENIWLTQKMMAALYDVSVPAINQHLKRLYGDLELEPAATIKKWALLKTHFRQRAGLEAREKMWRRAGGEAPDEDCELSWGVFRGVSSYRAMPGHGEASWKRRRML